MKPIIRPIELQVKTKLKSRSATIKTKFWVSHLIALLWMCLSVIIALPWLNQLALILSFPAAFLIIAGISYIPGYMLAFLVISLVQDIQTAYRNEYSNDEITILIAAHNEEDKIFTTLRYIEKQDYPGKMNVFVINNCSTDETVKETLKAKRELTIDIKLFNEEKQGKFHALNHALKFVKTRYLITIDADTLLHPSSIRYLVARIKSSPEEVCAVAGSVLTKNSRENLWTKSQEWDYFLGIASIKRLQGLYQGTLVAQGAYSLYKTSCIQEIGGWPDAIGEDIVLTWRLLKNNWIVNFEPLAVAFTEVPSTLKHLVRQRARWARGMIEGLKEVKPWEQPRIYVKYLTSTNLIMPYLDLVYTICWIPGLLLAMFGYYYIVGPATLLVLPLTFMSYSILYFYQKNYVFRPLNLRIRKNKLGLLFYILFYQLFMSPVSVYGYVQEVFNFKRKWK